MPDKNVWVTFTSIDREFESTVRSGCIHGVIISWENGGRTTRVFVNETPIWIGYGEDALVRAKNIRDDIVEAINTAEAALIADAVVVELKNLIHADPTTEQG